MNNENAFARAFAETMDGATLDTARRNLQETRLGIEGFSALGWKPTEAEVQAERVRLYPEYSGK